MLITNAELVTWEEPNRILHGHAIRIQGTRISELGPSTELLRKYPEEPVTDARGQMVLPGNICAHTHFYGAFSRGMSIPGEAPADFPQILQKLWWPLDRSLTEEDIRYSALLCLVDAIKHGTTSLVDHHASPNAIDGSLDLIADAARQAGVRAILCYEVSDRDGPEKMRAGIRENLRFMEAVKGESTGSLAATFGLHASLTLSDATLDLGRSSAPESAGFHIHVAESDADQLDSMAKSHLRVVERLKRHEILGPRTIAAHAVHVNEHEIELLADSNTWVSHQPRSNMNNGVGVAPVQAMLQAGVPVCLGNDGFSNAMWDEWRTVYLVHKVHDLDPRHMAAGTVLEMAVRNNAALVSSFFPGLPVGTLQVGAAADLIFVDYLPPTPLSEGNLPWHIIFGFRETMISATMVNGKFLMMDHELVTLDERAIAARARELAIKVWERYESKV